MINWLTQLDGTNAAIGLAFFSAICHAIFGALQKSKNDPLLIRAASDFWFVVLALPFALFVFPWPTAHEWLLIAGIFPIHTAYKLVLAQAYRAGDYSFIYPIARGSSPFFTAALGIFIFGENLAPVQWLGIIIISAAIIGMGIEALSRSKMDRALLNRATTFALITGILITAYSLYDAHGVRVSRSPFIFLAWFYVVDGWFFPAIVMFKRDRYQPVNGYKPLLTRGFIMSLFGIASFSAIFIASDIGKVGEIFAIRETSVVWAALISFFILGEKVTPLRFLAIALIAVGAILIKTGSLG